MTIAIDRRSDRAVVEIGLRFVERALFDLHIRLGLMQRRHRLIEIGLRGILFLRPVLECASALSLRKLERRLGAGEIALRLRHRGLKKHRIDLRDDVCPAFTLELKSANSF